MRWSLRFSVLGVLAAGLIVGCGGDEPVPNPVWKAMCEGFCGRAVQCISEVPVEACVSICLSELGGVSCEGNEEALETCVADMDEMPCWAIDQGQLPQSCDDICLCQDAEDCDDGNPCTAGVCNQENGSCGATPVADGVLCVGEAGTCEQSRCVMACTETGIRTAIVAGGGPYVFDCDRPTTLTTQAEIIIDNDVILDGDNNLTLDADGRHRVLSVSAEFRPIVELHNLTVTGGAAADFGGGIRNFGTLTLDNCTVSGSTANDGGGASNSGILTVVNSIISENAATFGGGGLDNDDTLKVTNSTISENSAFNGAGLRNRASATLTDTTVERNTTTAMGGSEEAGGAISNTSDLALVGCTVTENVAEVFVTAGIVNYMGNLTITNSTVSGNLGRGLYTMGTATLISCTLSGNTGEVAGLENDRQLILRNTLIDDACDGQSPGDWLSLGGNIESPLDTCRLDDPSDQVNVTAEELNLGPLQDNRGATFTHLPGSPSAAIDAVPDGACVDVEEMALTTDQRGEPRPKGPRCDSGAAEAEFDPMLCARVDCDDGIDCTDDGVCNPTNGLCEGGADAPRNTPCDQEGGKFCDGSGSCVECNDANQCDDRNDCTVDSCNPASASCDHNTVPDDTGCAQGAGTCQQGVCIGEFACTEQGVRDAIAQGGGPHAFSCTGPTTVVTAAEIVIDNDVILDGVGNLMVDGNGTHRVFSVPPGITAELRRVTVTGGGGPFVGAGIRNEGTLTVTNSTVTKNTAAAHSGGIYNDGTLTLSNSVVSENAANPTRGGIFNLGTMSLTESTVSGNTALDSGGIENSGTLSVSRSTISGNIAELGQIGGILHHSGTLMLTNSTVAQNMGVGIQSSGTLIATHSTISGNMGRAISGGGATVTNTVIDGTCSSTLEVSGGGNIESPGDTCGFDRPSDRVSVPTEQVNLGPLQDNGGPTLTRLPGLGSVTIDEVDCAVSTDQRGVTRPQGPKCDVGAVEVEAQP
jgi:hypothetical protein